MRKPLVTQQGYVLTEFIRNQHIFQGLSFLRNFHFTVIVPAFVVIIVFNKIPVE